MTNSLLKPYEPMSLPNRIVMAPMTRFRGDEQGVPQPFVAEYYAQRAGAGLIVTEGIWPSVQGQGALRGPGLVSPEQVVGWRAITGAVHAAEGRIFAQLMHAGRLTVPDNNLGGLHPIAPSPVPADIELHTASGKVRALVPREMTTADIAQAIDEHVASARRAIDAGFDGVELHGANGYLLHQFLADNTNVRGDRYGGAGRIRFAVEVVEAVAGAIGAGRVGIRLSPGNPLTGLVEADPAPVYRELVGALEPLGLAYLHLTDNSRYRALRDIRPRWTGTLIGNTGFGHPTTAESGAALIEEQGADLVSFGRLFISNPDLPQRFAAGAPLAEVEEGTLYTHGPQGYVDYPAAT
ncbi:N-ethylmaleimide reductase [Saccharopolyspora antimicrobica]|uniref:N-ethylmaleimide reductase n=1 Tax=Saccharopolyspora antimicrobica TaxID=455193 RepID=A0A1I4QF43_9PSEU|nr:alkene reductase [Saccharopolyspora antimicrobica]RKT84898.1 N-ethylmaleimide reductase [Saccharopolyspora antimicrobica]SFM38396.1 N-ethylmaleimide reductase [Saccharopolyspora antimicrobica]